MAYDSNNIFAKILRDEIPSVKVHEDDHILAFMDVMPQGDGHVLVIPKEPAETLLDLSPDGAARLIAATQDIARAVMKGLSADGITIQQFNFPAGGQSIPHVHFHVVPRMDGVPMRRHSGAMEDSKKLQGFAERIKAAL